MKHLSLSPAVFLALSGLVCATMVFAPHRRVHHRYDAYTVFLCHFDGVDGGTTFTDVSGSGTDSPHTLTANGDAQVDTDAADPWGGNDGTLYCDGTGDYVTASDSTDWDFGTGAYTIEFWVKPTSLYDYARIWCTDESDVTGHLFYLTSGGVLGCLIGDGGGWDVALTTSNTLSTGTWYHVALVREGTGANETHLYLAGNDEDQGTAADAGGDAGDKFEVGRWVKPTPDDYYTGYLDEFRISKGVARYTANFTPSSSPFTP